MDDRPYQTERPDTLKRRVDQCGVAGLERTQGPRWSLTRWKAVHELIVGWYSNDAMDVDQLIADRIGWMDGVQRLLVERLFAGWRAMFPRDDAVEVILDPPAASHFDHERRVELRVQPTFGFREPDGSIEWVRLRTGRSATSPEEAAVFVLGGEEGVTIDALVGLGVAEELPAPSDPEALLTRLLAADDGPIDRHRDRRPGPWCFSCESAPRCGNYPLVEPGRLYVSTRSINISKTQLGWLDICQRRVAWDRLYAVRLDSSEESERPGATTGIVFHEMAAAAALADDPETIVEAACRSVAPSEAAELQRMWANHERLWEQDGNPEARTTEYPAGVTFLVPGVHVDRKGRKSEQPVAVTMIGVLDLTGREPDGTPMVVEHRTGRVAEHGALEVDLYSLATAEFIRATTGSWPDRVAVHLHGLGPEEPTCARTMLDRSALEEARSRLGSAARLIASWDPEDTLDPAYNVGKWCERCHHREICENFRQ